MRSALICSSRSIRQAAAVRAGLFDDDRKNFACDRKKNQASKHLERSTVANIGNIRLSRKSYLLCPSSSRSTKCRGSSKRLTALGDKVSQSQYQLVPFPFECVAGTIPCFSISASNLLYSRSCSNQLLSGEWCKASPIP